MSRQSFPFSRLGLAGPGSCQNWSRPDPSFLRGRGQVEDLGAMEDLEGMADRPIRASAEAWPASAGWLDSSTAEAAAEPQGLRRWGRSKRSQYGECGEDLGLHRGGGAPAGRRRRREGARDGGHGGGAPTRRRGSRRAALHRLHTWQHLHDLRGVNILHKLQVLRELHALHTVHALQRLHTPPNLHDPCAMHTLHE